MLSHVRVGAYVGVLAQVSLSARVKVLRCYSVFGSHSAGDLEMNYWELQILGGVSRLVCVRFLAFFVQIWELQILRA